MKKTILSYALLFALSPLLLQCVAAEKEVRGIDLRQRTLDGRVAELERRNETTDEAVRAHAANQARLGSNLDQINNRLLRQDGRMEEADHQRRKQQEEIAQLRQNLGGRVDRLELELQQLNARLTAIAELDAKLKETDQKLQAIQEKRAQEAAERATAAAAAAKTAEEARQAAAKAAAARPESSGPKELVPEQVKKKGEEAPVATASATPPAAAPADKKAGVPGRDVHEQGLGLFKEKKYKEAYAAFNRYLEQHPKGELAADARFHLGECLYQQKEYELAILEYQKVIADFSGHARVPAALFKQGMAFEALKEPATATIVYNKLVADFPKSEAAESARKRLAEIK